MTVVIRLAGTCARRLFDPSSTFLAPPTDQEAVLPPLYHHRQRRRSGIPGGTLSSSAGSTSKTVASLAIIPLRRSRLLSCRPPCPRSPIRRQAFDQARGQLQIP